MKSATKRSTTVWVLLIIDTSNFSFGRPLTQLSSSRLNIVIITLSITTQLQHLGANGRISPPGTGTGTGKGVRGWNEFNSLRHPLPLMWSNRRAGRGLLNVFIPSSTYWIFHHCGEQADGRAEKGRRSWNNKEEPANTQPHTYWRIQKGRKKRWICHLLLLWWKEGKKTSKFRSVNEWMNGKLFWRAPVDFISLKLFSLGSQVLDFNRPLKRIDKRTNRRYQEQQQQQEDKSLLYFFVVLVFGVNK